MKKIHLFFALAAVLLLVSCGQTASGVRTTSGEEGASAVSEAAAPADNGGQTADENAPAAVVPDTASKEGWVMSFDNGTVIPLGAAADETVALLGEPADLMEAPSCIREGYDRVYTYGGSFTLTTAPDASGTDIITEVTLLSDAVAVVENGVTVMIGSPVSDADAAFGEPREAAGAVRRYELPGGTLIVTDADGEIAGISACYEG